MNCATKPLNDVNEGPTLSASGYSVNENSSYGTYAGYMYASGYSGTVSYSITGGNTDVDGDGYLPFYVSSYGGSYAYIYVNDADDLNYESQSQFGLKVSATDYYGTTTASATVSLYNLNEAPVLSGSTLYVNENSSNWTSVGTVSGSDPEGGTLSYSITSGNTDVDGDGTQPFYMSSSGQIYVYDSGDLNYESRSSFALTVQATDSAYNSTTATTTVYLNDVNEGPTLSASGYSVNENSSYGTYAGYMYASGYSGTVSYSITGGNTDVDGDGSLPFYVSKYSNGYAYIYVNDAGDLNYESQSEFDLTVSATDNYGTTTTVTSVSLENLNETPSGAVTVRGTAVQGQELEVVSTLKDPDGASASPAKVQWLRNGASISGATSSAYTLTTSDVGQSIAARVSYTDGGGFAESVTSSAVTVAGLNPGVTITGSDKTTGENGDTAVFSVKLDKAPVDSVTVKFAVSDTTEAKLSSASLTFTAANWNDAQTLTVTGLDDYDNDSHVAYNLTASVATDDLSYKRVTVSPIALSNQDDALDAPIQKNGTDDIDYLKGNNGDDRLYGRGNMDDIRGGHGDDRLYGEQDDDVLYGDDGNDWIYGGYDDDKLFGGIGNDELYGEEGADSLEGGTGNDYLDGGTGADTMTGGAGNDTYFVDNAKDVVDDKGASTDEDTVIVMSTISYKLAANVENAELQDTSGAASLTGNTLSNDLTGNASKNTLDGGAGNDVLDAGAGNDSLLGGDGTDILVGGLGNDSLNGGTGDDQVDYSDAAAGFVNVDLTKGTASGDGADTLVSIEDVIGSDGADTITGNTASNELTGGLGDDKLNGGGGADILYAGTGNDTVDAGDGNDLIIGGDGAGNDKYIGGAGTDTVKYTSATAGITVDLVKGTATSTAGKDAAKIGTDSLSGIENVIAGNYNDIVKGNTLANVLTGGLGTDSLYGGAGDKVKDVFDFNAITESKTGTARDKVYDFVSKIDQIDLSGIDANTASTKAGDQAFVFSGTTANANSVWYQVADVDGNATTKDIVVYGDVTGDAKADFEIGLVGVTAIAAADFVL